MKRIILILAVLAAAVSCSKPYESQYPHVTAHRGCWLKDLIPENSLAGVQMARRFGYPSIEMDVKYTLDSVMVVMHDKTINRTMRNAADYSEIAEPVVVTETPFEELRNNYVFASNDPAQRVQIPTLEEMLLACKENGIHPVLHSEVAESYEMAKAIVGDDFTAFSVNYEKMCYARSVADCDILWDPDRTSAEETCAKLTELGGKCGMSTMKWNMLDAAYIATIRSAGYDVQSSIFVTPHEVDAIHDGANIILSDFCWLQTEGRETAGMSVVKSRTIEAGQEIIFSSSKELEFGAVVVDMLISGNATVVVNGERTYEVANAAPDKFIAGFRVAGMTPEVAITAGEGGCLIKKATIRFYEI